MYGSKNRVDRRLIDIYKLRKEENRSTIVAKLVSLVEASADSLVEASADSLVKASADSLVDATADKESDKSSTELISFKADQAPTKILLSSQVFYKG